MHKGPRPDSPGSIRPTMEKLVENWAQIEELFQAALALPKQDRAAYLLARCPDNEPLRREVQQLLNNDDSPGFLEGSPLAGLSSSQIVPGTSIAGGRFQVLALIGSGGMGDVYKAHDTRLNRTVALKLFRENFTNRFEREARAVASFTHPNICTLYDVGPDFLVLEFIDGKPIRGPLHPDVALQYAIQAADALHCAHRKGIIHRDIKPANILVTAAGIKIVDFGIAKRADTLPSDPADSNTLTNENQIPGTLRYMAPEQLEGQPADARSDIYAFGLVFYETISGSSVFSATNSVGLMASILKDDPPSLASILPAVSPALARVIRKCMSKDPEARWQSAADLRDELQWIAQQTPVPAPAPANFRRAWRPWLLAFLILLTVGATTLILTRDRSGTATPVIVLMDTSAPSGVYDDDTRLNSGTNADDLSNALRDLPAVLQKETVGVAWNREDQILKQMPALILVHRSAFVHALAFEFRPNPAITTPQSDPSTDNVLYSRLSTLGRDKLDSLLGYFGKSMPNTQFIIYSRDWPDASQRRWIDAVTHRYPQLVNRVTTLRLEKVDGKDSFRAPKNAERVLQLAASKLVRR